MCAQGNISTAAADATTKRHKTPQSPQCQQISKNLKPWRACGCNQNRTPDVFLRLHGCKAVDRFPQVNRPPQRQHEINSETQVSHPRLRAIVPRSGMLRHVLSLSPSRRCSRNHHLAEVDPPRARHGRQGCPSHGSATSSTEAKMIGGFVKSMKQDDRRFEPGFKIYALTQSLVSSVLHIEHSCFAKPHSYERISSLVSKFSPVSLWCAVIDDSTAAGYMLVKNDMASASVQILSIAVDHDCRRLGVGRSLVDFAIDRLAPNRIVLAAAPESRLESQLFFSACGLTCISTFGRYYADGSSALIFQRRPEGKKQPYYAGRIKNAGQMMHPRNAPGTRK